MTENKNVFDLESAIKRWCLENGHDGFYFTGVGGDPCGCKIGELAPCCESENITNGICNGGKLISETFIDANGNECDWAIVPHDFDGSLNDD